MIGEIYYVRDKRQFGYAIVNGVKGMISKRKT